MFSTPPAYSRRYYEPIQPVEKRTLTALLLFSALLFVITFFLDPSVAKDLTHETGLFEKLSPPLWVALAALCLITLGYRSRYAIGTTLLALIFAAREMDLHKAFTADSIFKNAFYRMNISMTQKVFGGLAAAMCVAVLLWLLIATIRYFYAERAWRQAWGRLTIVAICLIFFTKIMDRIDAVLSVDYGYHLQHQTVMIFHMHEEGFEMLLPIVFALALLTWRRRLQRP